MQQSFSLRYCGWYLLHAHEGLSITCTHCGRMQVAQEGSKQGITPLKIKKMYMLAALMVSLHAFSLYMLYILMPVD